MPAFVRQVVVHSEVLATVVAWRLRVAALALASLAITTSPRAEESAATRISAAELLARVGRSHPSLELLEAAIEKAAAGVRAAGVLSNPTLSYDREEVFVSGRGQPENVLRLELPLEISGRRGLRVKGAKLGLEAARAGSARDRATLLFEALEIYWSGAAAKQVLELLRQERQSLGRLLESVRSRTSAGDTSGYDLDRLELEAGSLEDLIADRERELEANQRRLGLLVGAPGSRLQASDPLVLPARPATLEGLLREALGARGDLKAARLRVAQAERELRAAGRGWVPGLLLAGGLKSSTLEAGQTAWGYLGGLSLTLPIFDHGQGEAAGASARLRQARSRQRLIEAQVTSAVATAHGALTRALAQAERFERTQVPRLDRLVRRAQVSYREGERPVFELLDALRTARAVRLRSLELKREAGRIELELRRAVGRRP
jgi:cobalt-zinc-cadmium efflux system outer membrane protein